MCKLDLKTRISPSLEGCPILRQIYAWHCIVFTSHNNTVQKHNNKESGKTIRTLTMLCINLSEYWTSMHPFTRQIPKIHPLSIPREDISIHLSPIRVNLSPMHLHQGTQTNSGYSKENGYPDSNLSRRHAHHEQHLPGCPGRHPNPEVHSRESRISDKHGKIHFHPCAGHRIPGNPCKLYKDSQEFDDLG